MVEQALELAWSSQTSFRKECGRDECVMCYQREGNKVTKCLKNNVGYEAKCGRCPTRFSYLGETSRTAFTRTKEHMSDYRAAAAAKLPLSCRPCHQLMGRLKEGRKMLSHLCGSTAETIMMVYWASEGV